MVHLKQLLLIHGRKRKASGKIQNVISTIYTIIHVILILSGRLFIYLSISLSLIDVHWMCFALTPLSFRRATTQGVDAIIHFCPDGEVDDLDEC